MLSFTRFGLGLAFQNAKLGFELETAATQLELDGGKTVNSKVNW